MKAKHQPWQQKRSVTSCLARTRALGLASRSWACRSFDPFTADQAHTGADGVVFEHEIPADGVKQELQRPHTKGTAGAVAKEATVA